MIHGKKKLRRMADAQKERKRVKNYTDFQLFKKTWKREVCFCCRATKIELVQFAKVFLYFFPHDERSLSDKQILRSVFYTPLYLLK